MSIIQLVEESILVSTRALLELVPLSYCLRLLLQPTAATASWLLVQAIRWRCWHVLKALSWSVGTLASHWGWWMSTRLVAFGMLASALSTVPRQQPLITAKMESF